MAATHSVLQGGALIIGSLLWDQHLQRDQQDSIRINWRRQHLLEDEKIQVYAPIRYGRKSAGEIYTMTFANSCKANPGKAWLVPFKQSITTLEELDTLCKALSRAEGMQEEYIKSNAAGEPWAVIGLLCNPEKIAVADRVRLVAWWEKQFGSCSQYQNFNAQDFKLGVEAPCVLGNGLLNIPWPAPVKSGQQSALDKYDFLIATATRPSGPKYPSVEKLKDSIQKDTLRRYYLQNQEHGITTFQDERINAKLRRSQSGNVSSE